jgi:hypothetical protein
MVHKLTDRVIYAVLSSVAYKANLQEKYKQLKKYGLNRDYFILRQFTNKNITAFYDFINKKIIIAFRGTDSTNKTGLLYDDLLTDIFLGLGLLRTTKRFVESKNILEKAIKKYGKKNITLTGHSLGAAIADYLSSIYKIPAITYNTGSTPISVIDNPLAKRYTTGNFDILSFSDKLYNESIIGSKEGHGIKGFTKYSLL